MVPASEAQQRQILDDPLVKRVMELFDSVPVNIERRLDFDGPAVSRPTQEDDDSAAAESDDDNTE